MKTITVRDSEDNPYTLTFTAKSVMELEHRGFDPNHYDTEPVSMTILFVEGALKAKHPNATQDKAIEILELIDDKEGFIQALTEIYTDVMENLMVNKGKKKWEANF